MTTNLAFNFDEDPLEVHRQERLARHAELAGKYIAFPDLSSFSDFFATVDLHRKCGATYCNQGTGHEHPALYVTAQPLVATFIREQMLQGFTVYFNIIKFDDGLALVTASYNEIIGDRWLGYIYLDTIPCSDKVEPDGDECDKAGAEPDEPVALDAMAILSEAAVVGNTVRLSCGQLDRKLYEKVAGILGKMGGKWNRKVDGFVFKDDPNEHLELLFLTGKIRKPEKFGYFPTPTILAEDVVSEADIKPNMEVLEPEAGQGGLADVISRYTDNLTCYELQDENVLVLKEKGYKVMQGDFLSVTPQASYDVIVMNPPFERLQDIAHVLHAWQFLKPGGRLVAIMSLGFTFRNNKCCVEFRDFVEEFGRYKHNPDGSFRQSGTNVGTLTVILDKPAH